MKESTKNKAFNALYYLFIAILISDVLMMTFQFGFIKGMSDAHKTQLKEQIRLLEQEKQESMIRQISNQKQ